MTEAEVAITRRSLLALGTACAAAALCGTHPLLAQAGTTVEPQDLEVITVTDTSITFGWTTYSETISIFKKMPMLVAADTELLLGPVDGQLRQVFYDATGVFYHQVTITGLEPGRSYRFEARSNGQKAYPSLLTTQNDPVLRSGTFTTLTPPPGRYVRTIALANDTHVGLGESTREPGYEPYSYYLMAGLVENLQQQRINRLFINGDLTSEGRPHELVKAKELLDRFGTFGTDYFITRGNHDRPHQASDDPRAHYDSVPAMPGTKFHDNYGVFFTPHQQHWVTRVGGLRMIGMDSSRAVPSALSAGGSIDAAQFKAVEEELERDPDRPTIMLCHHPVSDQAALTAFGGRGFVLNLTDAIKLQQIQAKAPGVFLQAAGHTHRPYRSSSPYNPGCEYNEFTATGEYPSCYTQLRLYTGGYMITTHRIDTALARHRLPLERWSDIAISNYTVGTVQQKNYVVIKDLSGIE